jgi:hypothetical protein
MGTFEQIRSVKLACAGNVKTAQTDDGSSASRSNAESFAALDTNDDGMLGRIEAAADPDAKSRFDRLDTNDDQKLSRTEYQAWDKVSSAVQ